MQATEQYFPVEMLISMNKVNLTLESVNEKPAARQVLSPRTLLLNVSGNTIWGSSCNKY